MNFLIFKIVFYPDLIYVSFSLLNYASIAKSLGEKGPEMACPL